LNLLNHYIPQVSGHDIQVSWVITFIGSLDKQHWRFETTTTLRDVENYLPSNTTQHSRRFECTAAVLCETQISPSCY